MTHARTPEIGKAMDRAKERDGYRCRVCRWREGIDGFVMRGSHCFGRNQRDPTREDMIITMCVFCDDEFEAIKTAEGRIAFLRAKRLDEFAERMADELKFGARRYWRKNPVQSGG